MVPRVYRWWTVLVLTRPVPVNRIAAQVAHVGALGRVDLNGIGFDLD
jgi:hypothetical protein